MLTCVLSNTDLVCTLSDLNIHLCQGYDLQDAVSFTFHEPMRTYPKLLRTNGKLAAKFRVGAPKFGVGVHN